MVLFCLFVFPKPSFIWLCSHSCLRLFQGGDLSSRLEEAERALAMKQDAIDKLKEQVEQLKSSLDTIPVLTAQVHAHCCHGSQIQIESLIWFFNPCFSVHTPVHHVIALWRLPFTLLNVGLLGSARWESWKTKLITRYTFSKTVLAINKKIFVLYINIPVCESL